MTSIRALGLALGLLLLGSALGVSPAAAAGEAVFDHAAFDGILRRHVKAGRVDYAAIRRESRAELDGYLGRVAVARPQQLGRAERLAFYLNAYNALVIRAVVERYPLSSVTKVKGFFDRVQHAVGGQRLTLNDLENKVIRKQFDEPRIHFALVCAARSCPPLQSRAYRGGDLAATLERATRGFLGSKSGVQLEGSQLRVSRIFEWYRPDFDKAAGSVVKYVARYRPLPARAELRLSFLPYDWTLNGQ